MAGLFLAEGIETVVRPLGADDDPSPSLPFVPEPQVERVVRGSGAMQVAGGIMLLTDVAPRAGAGLIGLSLVPVTLAGAGSATTATTGSERARHLLRNLALLGAAVITAMDTEGNPGIGWRAGRLKHDAGREAEWRKREAELLTQLAMAKAHTAASEARARTVVPARQVLRDARVATRVVRATGRGVRRLVRTPANA